MIEVQFTWSGGRIGAESISLGLDWSIGSPCMVDAFKSG